MEDLDMGIGRRLALGFGSVLVLLLVALGTFSATTSRPRRRAALPIS